MTDATPAQPRWPRPRRRYHFHIPGVMYVGVTLFLAVGAINSQNNLLFSALGLAIGGLLVSGVLSGASLMGVRVERLPLAHGSVGSPMALRYAVSNSNRFFPAFGLHIVEVEAGEGRSWRGLFAQPRAFVVHVGPGRTARAEATVLPRRRGELRLSAVQVWSTFPFGLAKKSVTFYLPQTGVVHPPELPLRAGLVARLTSRSDHGLGGERDPGTGDEFYGLREYVPGDNPRRVAWRRSARTGEIVVRQHAAPSPQKLWVVLDLDLPAEAAPAAGLISRERAIALASAVLRVAGASGIATGLAVPATRLLLPLRPGRWHVERLQAQLAVLDTDFLASGAVSASLPPSAMRGGACVVIHADAAADRVGPPGARHLGAAEADQFIEPTPAAAALLALLGTPAAEEAGVPRRPVGERVRSALGLPPERAA